MMKVCIAICVFLFVHTCYGKNIPVESVAETTACKSVEFDNGMVEFNYYVSNNMRAEVCAKHIFNYNATGRMPMKYLGEEYNYNSHQNPCTVVCRYDPMHESIIDEHAVLEEHNTYFEAVHETPYAFAEYRGLPLVEFKLAEHAKCGPEHVCNPYGCCVQEEPKEPVEEHKEPVEEHKEPVEEHKEPVEEHKEPVEEHKEPVEEHKEPQEPVDPHTEEHKEPEQPVEEHKEPEHPVEEHKEPQEPVDPHQEPEHPVEEHKEPEHPVEEHKEPEHPEEHKEPEVPEKEYACKESGVFVDEEDETSFFRCYLKSAHVKCAEGMVFNRETHECHTPLPPEPNFEQLITCSAEGYFRNPYDCKHFYRCFYNDEAERAKGFLRVAFFKCQADMVFDSASHNCVPAERAEACDNKLIPHEPEAKEVKEPEYEKLLQCTAEGYFRNPYECHLFYRCYYNHFTETDLRLALFACDDGKVFDEVSKNCVPAERTNECHNKEVPVESHYKH